ncbi:MAG: FAD-binding protein [Candidatus Lokiarchaeota archaeon]|nr:FAD-binding protein [Candidatus Lokiarchaeota archaeon]
MEREELYNEITKIIDPKYVSIDQAVLYCYACDVSNVEHMPDVVTRPITTEDIANIVKYAYKKEIPITPRGAGTGAAGGSVPIKGGILIDLTRMNKISEISIDDLQVIVEPGVIHKDLNDKLKSLGFRFPVKPGSSEMCTIGGMVANNASGMNAVKYGSTRNYILELEVVLPNGSVGVFGSRAMKDVTGYDLCSLYAGSEGTLGIITRITLKILPIPDKTGVLIANFSNLYNAGNAVVATFQSRIIPSAIEILDKSSIQAINKYKPEINLPDVEAILLFEFDGYYQCIEKEIEVITEVCRNNNSINIKKTLDDKEKDELWESRSLVGAASSRVREGYSRVYLGEDIAVPISKIPEILLKLRNLSKKYDFPIVTFGHISVGNLHPAITIRKNNPEDWKNVMKLNDEIHQLALKYGGTVTAEHGIGIARAKYLKENSPQTYQAMKLIKKALDPKNIMNPGKMALEE